MNKEIEINQLDNIISEFILHAKDELDERWKKWNKDFSQIEVHEVIIALLARQVSLSRNIAENPQIWNYHIAPLILRAMADVYINIAWIIKEPLNRSQKFILYGLGQAKLQLEHFKSDIGNREPSEEEQMIIDANENWLNAQRFTFLTKVNVGSWSGISTRQMAEEAECLDFYNHVYSKFSSCTHSTWQHICRFNLKHCENPLHQYHRLPDDPLLYIEIDNFYLAAKYLKKSFSIFDKHFKIKPKSVSAYNNLCKNLDELTNKISDKNSNHHSKNN